MAKQILRCISEPTSNQYYTTPFEIGEKVLFLGDVEDDGKHAPIYYKQFIRIKRLKPFEDRVELRKNFSPVKYD